MMVCWKAILGGGTWTFDASGMKKDYPLDAYCLVEVLVHEGAFGNDFLLEV